MKERPIVMTAESVRAMLNGHMTQTRRVVKPQPSDIRRSPFVPSGIEDNHGYEIKLAYGIPGDRLWVRETWDFVFWDVSKNNTSVLVTYGADGGQSRPIIVPNNFDPILYNYQRWRSPIFMPRWASRITLEILNIRVERVQEITYLDLEAEGMQGELGAAMEQYVNLWDTLNAKRGYPWADNPWVWVISFRVLP